VRTVSRVCVTLETTQPERLRAVQARLGQTRSQCVRLAVEAFLRKFERPSGRHGGGVVMRRAGDGVSAA